MKISTEKLCVLLVTVFRNLVICVGNSVHAVSYEIILDNCFGVFNSITPIDGQDVSNQ